MLALASTCAVPLPMICADADKPMANKSKSDSSSRKRSLIMSNTDP